MGPRVGLEGEIRSPDRPASRESLHRLRYPGSQPLHIARHKPDNNNNNNNSNNNNNTAVLHQKQCDI